MDIQMLPDHLSKLVGGYDKQLEKRANMGAVGYSEYQCYVRFLDDLERSKNDDYNYFFDDSEVKKVLKFCSLLQHYDGQGNIRKLELYPWQKFVVLNLFGWRHKQSGLLRYRESYISVGRRNGKSALASTLLHYFMTCSSFRSERAICFSAKKDLAYIVFRQFIGYIDADEDLAELYSYSKTGGYAESLGTNNFLEVFSGDTNADGFQSGYSVADEIALQDGKLYSLIYDGQANLPQSQIIGITTAGFDIRGWCHKKYMAIKMQMESQSLPDNLFVYIAEPDEGDNFADPMVWAKANPLLFFDKDANLRMDKVQYYESKYQQALNMGGHNLVSFLTKQVNHWCADADSKLCNMKELDVCFKDVTFAEVMSLYKNWYLGIDLAKTRDLNSIAFTTWIKWDVIEGLQPPDSEKGEWRLYSNVINWIPAATLKRHIDSDHFEYNEYVGKELFLTYGAQGKVTSYGEICDYLDKLSEDNELNYVTIACDPYGVAAIQARLEDMCETLIMQSQHRKAKSPYIELIANYVYNHTFVFSKDSSAIFERAVKNAVVSKAEDGWLEVKKPAASPGANFRIDPVDALINAIIAPIIDRDKICTESDEIDDWLEFYRNRKAKQ